MELSKAISYRISQLLAEKDWSSYKLSGKCAVPTSTISNILLRNGKSCTLSTLNNLCRGFGIKLVTLFDSELFDPENLDDND